MANKEKVEVKGGGDFDGAILQNAASEKTLKDLYNLFKDQKHDKKGADKIVELHEKTVKKNIKAVDESTDSYKQVTKELDEMKKKSQEFRESMSEIVGLGIGSAFTMIYTSAKALGNFFLTGFDALKETNKVGAGFNNDIVGIRRAAAEAAIPLEMFVDIIKQNSQTFSALGGTVSEGAKAFGAMSKEFRKSEVGEKLQTMGYSVGELNQLLADQIELDMRTGKLRGKDSATLRKETETLAMGLDKLSKATGIARAELEKGLKQAVKDGRILALQSRINKNNTTALTNFNQNLALMNANFDTDMVNTFTSMMTGVIEPGDEFGTVLQSLTGNAMQFEQALASGAVTSDQAIEEYKKQSEKLTKYLAQIPDAATSKNAGIRKLYEYNASLQKLINANTGEAKKQQDAQNRITEALGNFSNFFNTLFGDILVSIVDSQAFKSVEASLKHLADVFLKNREKIINIIVPMVEKFLGVIDSMVKGIADFVDNPALNADNFADSVTGLIRSLGENLSVGIGKLFSGFTETPEQKAKRQKYEQATPEEKKKMEAADPSLKQTGIFEGMRKGMESLIALVPSLGQIAGFFGVTAVGSVAAGAGIGAGMALVAAGMTRLALPALALGAAIGMGGTGLGLAFEGLAKASEAAGNSLDKVGNFLKTLKEVSFEEVTKLGASLMMFGAAIGQLGVGGILNLIGHGGIDNFIESLKKFNEIDTGKIDSVGPALKKLSEGMAALNGKGLVDSLSSSLTDFVSGKGIASLAEAIKPLENVDMTKVSAFADGIDRISKINFANLENITKNNPIGNFMASFSKITDMDFGKIEESITKSLTAVVNGIAKVGDVTQGKVAEVLKNNSLASVVNMFSKLNDISFANIEKLTTNNALASVADSFTKIGQVNVGSVENTVSGIGKLGVTFNDTLTNNSKGVEDYIKSIDKLTDSLTKLEQKMKDMPALKTEAGQAGAPTRSIVATGDISGISAEDLQKQLNTKIDDLISHIVEMKQNTKDTADAISGRRSAL